MIEEALWITHRLHNYLPVTCSAAQRVAVVIWALSNKCLRNVNQSTTATFRQTTFQNVYKTDFQSLKVWQVMLQELTSWRGEATLSSFNEEVLFRSGRHSDVTEAMHPTLGRHLRRWALPSFHSSAHPSVFPSVRPNDVTILNLSVIVLHFDGMMHRAMVQIKWLLYLANFVRIPRYFEIIHDRLVPGPRDDIIALII